jgi:ribosome-associated protein
MESKKLAQLCRDLAENKKAENVVVLDVRKISSITDYFVIASGGAEPHLRAIMNEMIDRLREEHGVTPRAIDGDLNTAWQVVDFSDVIVHVMRADVRERYDLEGLWGDARRIARRRTTKRKPKASPKRGAKPQN